MFTLPKLPYEFEALEPYIDTQTMTIHYTKHHQTYANKLNEALVNYAQLQNKSVEELLKSLADLPSNIRTAVKNHGGGYYNHNFFWTCLKPKGQNDSQPSGELAKGINQAFGDYEKFKQEFSQAATALFGSGWAWLVIDSEQKLKIVTTANQDSPISQNQVPLLALDVWEHAYYLKYQNKRADYVDAWWNIVNWQAAQERYLAK